MRHRVLKILPPVIGVIVLAGVVLGLHGALRHISLEDVLAALRATPRHEVIHAFVLLAASFGVMLIYDVPGVLFAGIRLGAARIGLASFCAYALCHVLGAPALSAAAIRLRFYAGWGVAPAGIARIVALTGTNFTLGLMTLLSFILLLHPWDLPLFGHDIPHVALRLAGLALAGMVVLYVTLTRTEVRIFGRDMALPVWWVALAQVVVSCADVTLACGILYVVLPDAPGLSYVRVLGIYLAAFAGGLFSGLPGGVGVFDSLLLLGLAGYLDPATALGAILLFRVMYFLAPACVAALCYAGHEASASFLKKGRRAPR